MQQFPSSAESGRQAGPQAVVMAEEDDGMMRGLVYGVILSLVIWVAAGYLTFILR